MTQSVVKKIKSTVINIEEYVKETTKTMNKCNHIVKLDAMLDKEGDFLHECEEGKQLITAARYCVRDFGNVYPLPWELLRVLLWALIEADMRFKYSLKYKEKFHNPEEMKQHLKKQGVSQKLFLKHYELASVTRGNAANELWPVGGGNELSKRACFRLGELAKYYAVAVEVHGFFPRPVLRAGLWAFMEAQMRLEFSKKVGFNVGKFDQMLQRMRRYEVSKEFRDTYEKVLGTRKVWSHCFWTTEKRECQCFSNSKTAYVDTILRWPHGKQVACEIPCQYLRLVRHVTSMKGPCPIQKMRQKGIDVAAYKHLGENKLCIALSKEPQRAVWIWR